MNDPQVPQNEPALVPAPAKASSINFSGGALVPTNFDEAWRVSQLFARSQLVPKDYQGKAENCLVAMQFGAEIGLKPLQSLQGIAVIGGRPGIWGDSLWALVQSSSLVLDAFEEFDEATMTATCTIKRKNRSKPTVASFSKADAEKAGLWGKPGPWQTNPKRMLQMRARGFCCRDAVPEVLKGLAVAEEFVGVDVVEAEVVRPVEAPAAEIRPGAIARLKERVAHDVAPAAAPVGDGPDNPEAGDVDPRQLPIIGE